MLIISMTWHECVKIFHLFFLRSFCLILNVYTQKSSKKRYKIQNKILSVELAREIDDDNNDVKSPSYFVAHKVIIITQQIG